MRREKRQYTLIAEEFGDHEWVQALKRYYNVRYVEQLGVLLATDDGRQALSRLEYAPAAGDIPQLYQRVHSYMMESAQLSLSAPRNSSPRTGQSILRTSGPSYGLGYKLPDPLKDVDYGDTLPPSVTNPNVAVVPPAPPSSAASADLRSCLTPVRNQFFRGTCVAFATTALVESKIRHDTGKDIDLSEQYVYLRARMTDPHKEEDGTYGHYALDSLRQYGVCTEQLLRYDQHNDWGQRLMFHTPPKTLAQLDQDAASRRIQGYQPLNPKSVPDIKQALRNDQVVFVGVPMFRYAWYDNGVTEDIGEVQLPTTHKQSDGTVTLTDRLIGGHAVALIAFKDTPDPTDAEFRSGGGYFGFKNSWGITWAPNNPIYGSGFGILPYAYIEAYNQEAYIIS